MDTVTLEGRIKQITVNAGRKQLVFTVKCRDGENEVRTEADFNLRFKDEAPAFVGEPAEFTGVWEKTSVMAASAWRLLFPLLLPKNIALTVLRGRGMITPKQFWEELFAADGTKVGTLELAPQVTGEPTLFAGKEPGREYAYVVGWTLARTKDLRGNVAASYRILVDAERVESPAMARFARRKLHTKASEYAESLLPKWEHKMRTVISNRLEDKDYPDDLPAKFK